MRPQLELAWNGVMIMGIVGVALGAAPALPCTTSGPPDLSTFRPRLDAPVPLNAMWLADRMSPDTQHNWFVAAAGSDVLEPVTVTFDEDLTRLTPPALQPLTAYELVLLTTTVAIPSEGIVAETFEAERLPFTTAADEDTTAPAAPVIERSETVGRLPELFLATCGRNDAHTSARWFVERPLDARVVKLDRLDRLDRVDGSDGADEEIVPIRVVFTDPNAGDVLFLADQAFDESGRHDYVLTALDEAGNESEPTLTSADLGCPGACSTTTSAPFALFGLALLAARRRR